MNVHRIHLWSVVVLLILLGLRAPSAPAQVQQSAPPAPRDEPRSTKIHNLKSVKAAAVAETLKELFAGARDQVSIAVEEASNSLIVSTTHERAIEIDALVKHLDSLERHRDAEQQNRDRRLQIYYLKHAQAQEAANVLDQVVRDAGLNIAVDRRTNALILQAPEDQHEVIVQILEVLDSPKAEGEPGHAEAAAGQQRRLMLYFYWLASGKDFETDKPVPSQLLPVVEELEGLGFHNVQLVSRSVAALDGDVSMHSTVNAGNYTSLDLVVEGRSVSKGEDSLRLDFNVRATHADDVSHVETRITAPYNHFVVLGAAGLGRLENAFVIQIQSVEPAGTESDSRR
jgi:hypothetical protein